MVKGLNGNGGQVGGGSLIDAVSINKGEFGHPLGVVNDGSRLAGDGLGVGHRNDFEEIGVVGENDVGADNLVALGIEVKGEIGLRTGLQTDRGRGETKGRSGYGASQ